MHDITEEQIQQTITNSREIAAGWFVMAAKCLQAPSSNLNV